MSAYDLLQKKENYQAIPGFDFLGKLPSKLSILIYGLPGSGKSTFAFQLANVLSFSHPVLYAAIEEGLSASLKRKLEDQNIRSRNLFIISDDKIFDIVAKCRQVNAKHLVVDSLTAMKSDISCIRTLNQAITGMLILIVHATKQAVYKGNSSYGHFVDMILKADDRVITTDKTRFGPIGQIYEVFQDGDMGRDGKFLGSQA